MIVAHASHHSYSSKMRVVSWNTMVRVYRLRKLPKMIRWFLFDQMSERTQGSQILTIQHAVVTVESVILLARSFRVDWLLRKDNFMREWQAERDQV
jgi:hypothetical protein